VPLFPKADGRYTAQISVPSPLKPWSEGRWLILTGMVIAAGWRQYLISAAQLGLLGSITAAAFYALLPRGKA
jgi:hypothetical protein